MLGVIAAVNKFITDIEALEQIVFVSFDFVISFALVTDHTDNFAALEKILESLAGNIALAEQENDRSIFISEQTFAFIRQTDISDDDLRILVLVKQCGKACASEDQ